MPVADEPDDAVGTPRLRIANREQVEFRCCCWNDLLSEDHQARIVCQYVEDLVAVSEPQGSTTVYAPVRSSRDKKIDRHVPKADDAPAVAAWRLRMATAEAQEIYKDRAATAECVNAIARNRGLQQFRVRGSPKVLAVVLWYVLAHNLMRMVALRAKHEENRI